MRHLKTSTLLFALTASFASCKKDAKSDENKGPPTAEVPVYRGPPAVEDPLWMADDTLRVFQDCWAAFNSNDESAFAGCYADDAEFSYVDFAPPMVAKGSEAILAVAKMWWGGFPDAKGEAQLVLANETNFAAIVLMTQTNTGGGMMPPTGKRTVMFEAQFGSFHEDGKIAADHRHADQGTMAHQMGMQKSGHAPDSEDAWPEPIIVIAENDEAEKANVAFIESMGEMFEKQDVNAMLAVVTDDVSFRYVGDKKTASGKADYEKGLKEYMAMMKVTGRDVKSLWAAGDWVFASSVIDASTLIDMDGAKGSKGKELKLTQTEFFHVVGGKLKAHWVFENTMQYPIQLGLMDPTKMGAPPEGEVKGKPKK